MQWGLEGKRLAGPSAVTSCLHCAPPILEHLNNSFWQNKNATSQAWLIKSKYSALWIFNLRSETESNIREDHTCLCHSLPCFLPLRETDTYFCIYPKIGHTLPSPADSLLPGSAVSMEENRCASIKRKYSHTAETHFHFNEVGYTPN